MAPINKEIAEKVGGIDDDDNLDSQYFLARQVAHEYHSPAMALARNWLQSLIAEPEKADVTSPLPGQSIKQGTEKFVKQQRGETGELPMPEGPLFSQIKQKHTQKAATEMQGLEAPLVDPVMAFAGGAGGMLQSSLNMGMRLMPSLGRALTSGVVGAGAEYPIGVATEAVGAKFPGLEMPFALATGLLSGVTLERAIERGVVNAASKAGQKLSKGAIQQQAKFAKQLLASETGAIDLGSEHVPKLFNDLADAYDSLKVKTGYSNVPIADLRDELGVSQSAIEEMLKELSKKGKAVLTSGDWSLSDAKIRSGELGFGPKSSTGHGPLLVKLETTIGGDAMTGFKIGDPNLENAIRKMPSPIKGAPNDELIKTALDENITVTRKITKGGRTVTAKTNAGEALEEATETESAIKRMLDCLGK